MGITEAEAGKAKSGMNTFLKSYLDSTSAAHDAAVAATTSSKPVFGPTFNIAPPPKEKTDAELAREAEEKLGKKIELNDDGEILDRRQLMTGGLNVVAKRAVPGAGAKNGGFAVPISARKEPTKEELERDALLSNPGISPAERKRQARERQSRELERQMVQIEEKRKREAEEQLEQKVQKVAKRNTEDRVAELKRAAEEGRKKREEDKGKAAS
jgi:coiled-coil domain-containing protein 55